MSERFDNSQDRAPEAAPLAPLEFLRWTWRQLTSMRTALILLFLLALGSIPGSVIPQDDVDARKAFLWRQDHKTLAPLYEKLGLFHVFDSAWFSAIYILLMVSLVGCILPRTRVYAKALRARPPRTPSVLSRLPEYRSFTTDADTDAVLAQARELLRGYRVDVREDSVAAERGYLREAGNLLFHLAILVVLVGFASGSLFGYKGGVLVVTGGQFANVANQYDQLAPGSLFDTEDLAPFSLKVTDFDVTFSRDKRDYGAARNFSAGLDYQTSPEATTKHARVAVNHPLDIDGSQVFLIGHGYAPVITVRDGTGAVAYSGPVIFRPEDSTFRSLGVVKVPDASPEQLGFEGELYPSYAFSMATGPVTVFPEANRPVISMLAYAGDLGLDDGVPQSVYVLDKTKLKPIKNGSKNLRVDLQLGQTIALPNGLGSITFDKMERYVQLQISRNPFEEVALGGMILALLGLMGSLFIRPRRVWVAVRREDGRTLVEIAGLDRSAGGDLSGEVDSLAAELKEKA